MELNDSVLDHLRRVASAPDLAGTRYDLESEIGRGGMGVVYRAHDRELDRAVALKVVDAPLSGEAQLIARLEHPAVTPIYESGTLPDGRAFYAMKLVSGARLDHYVAGGPALADRLRVVRRAGEALAFAHSRGVIHRDLKPQNVMVGEFGEVYVMDWGVEAVAGTPGFRAPEARLDARSDVYALGALLAFVLPEPAPPALRAIAAKAMRADPEARYPSVAALLEDLERFQERRAVEAWSEPWWHRAQRFATRNAVLLWLLAAYAAATMPRARLCRVRQLRSTNRGRSRSRSWRYNSRSLDIHSAYSGWDHTLEEPKRREMMCTGSSGEPIRGPHALQPGDNGAISGNTGFAKSGLERLHTDRQEHSVSATGL